MTTRSHSTRKASSTTSSTTRYQPYQREHQSDGESRRANAKELPRRPPTPPTNKGASGEPADAVLDQDPTMRQCLIEIAHKYPGITPRNNYDILTLAMGVHHYSGPLTNDAVYAWLDERLLMENPSRGDKSPLEQATLAANENCQTLLDTPGQIGGYGPRPTQRHVYIRPIPNSEYSIRLWPGLPHVNQFNLDFVNTETHEAVNPPLDYELWAVPEQTTPWLSMGATQLSSVEDGFGIETSEIQPGEEKFILTEGLTCMLVRPGERNVRFKVPIRRQAVADDLSCDVLDLPEFID